MAFTPGALAIGLRQVVLTAQNGTKAEVAVAMSMDFSPEVISGTLEGNDQISAVDSIVRSYTWSLNSGGLDFDARQIIMGTSILTSGDAPNTVHWNSLQGGQEAPYFQIDARVLADDGGDVWATLWHCKYTGATEGAAYGQYWQPNFTGIAIARGNSNVIATIRSRETTINLPIS